uniref:Uncharacterized protein n=1 Tax=Oryza punctata TaxID=4537 RepID=A0A0E0LVV2_ORYPU
MTRCMGAPMARSAYTHDDVSHNKCSTKQGGGGHDRGAGQRRGPSGETPVQSSTGASTIRHAALHRWGEEDEQSTGHTSVSAMHERLPG